MSEHLADAVEAAARMLPSTVPDGREYAVSRALLRAAMPPLQMHLRVGRYDEVVDAVAALHTPGPSDHDGLTVCLHDLHAWPCPTVRIFRPG